MKFSELPETVRVKLSEGAEREFWHRVDEFGGVKTFSNAFDIPSSKMYNWKNKSSFIPVEMVWKVFGVEASDQIVAFKGPGRSKPVENPVFPLPENDEFLTRVELSVNVNKKGVPVYQSSDRGNAERFASLLSEFGDVPVKTYRRSVYEIRFPGYLYSLFEQMSFEQDLAALVDEEGRIENGMVAVRDSEIPVEEFGEELYSREKRLKLALAREDEKEIRSILAEEKGKVESVF